MIRTPAGPVRVFSLHLAHIAAEERLEQIDYLMAEHRRAPSDGGPWSGADDEPARNWTSGEPEPENPLAAIWMGDFNMEPGSAEYHRIVGSTPYHRGAAYHGGFVDAASVAGKPGEDFHTHVKTIDGKVTKRRLDHCFVGGMFAGRVRSVGADIGEVASDHFPVRVDIDLETPLAARSGG